MKKLSLVIIMLLASTLVTGCAAFFGKMDQENDWYGYMGTDTFMRYQEHKLLMETQENALTERAIALKERHRQITHSDSEVTKTAQNEYKGWLENEMGSTRTAQIIEVLYITRERFKEIEVVHAVLLKGREFAKIKLPEGYYLVKWYDSDFLVQTDKIKAAPHRTVDVVGADGKTVDVVGADGKTVGMEKLHFFSYCRR